MPQVMTVPAILVLRILQQLFVMQDVFMKHCGWGLTRIGDFLVEHDASTHLAERVLHIATLVGNGDPLLALGAVKILWHLSRSDSTQPKLHRVFAMLAPAVRRADKIRAFEVRLNLALPGGRTGGEYAFDDVVGVRHEHVENAVAVSILHLLLYNIDRPAPNLAHVLLGFPSTANNEQELSKVPPRHPFRFPHAPVRAPARMSISSLQTCSLFGRCPACAFSGVTVPCESLLLLATFARGSCHYPRLPIRIRNSHTDRAPPAQCLLSVRKSHAPTCFRAVLLLVELGISLRRNGQIGASPLLELCYKVSLA